MKTDGSARKKIYPERILDIYDVSPDGRWVAAGTPEAPATKSISIWAQPRPFAVDGTATVTVCAGYCMLKRWDTSGGFVYLSYPAGGRNELSVAGAA